MSYIPISIALLKKLKSVNSPVYISLTPQKFIKILNEGVSIAEHDLEKYRAKGVKHLYLDNWNNSDFLSSYKKEILTEATFNDISLDEFDVQLMMNTEILRQFVNTLKRGDDSVEITKRTVQAAMVAFKNEIRFEDMLQRFSNIESLKHSAHCVFLVHACTFLRSKLKTLIPSKHVQDLTLAAMLHDITLDDRLFDYKLKYFHFERVAGPVRENPDEHEVFRHPRNASELARTFDFSNPEVESIILQHHERADGSGFPNGSTSQKIRPLSALFIVAEDFVDYFMRQFPNPDWSYYVESRQKAFDSPPFREPFSVLRSSLEGMKK